MNTAVGEDASAPWATLVTEAFNLDEGQSLTALRATLTFMTEAYGSAGVELMIVVTSPDNADLVALLSRFPQVAVVDCRGLGYDDAKMKAVHRARGDIVAFLDGDCVPVDPAWLMRLTEPLRTGDALYVGGRTMYAGGRAARLLSVLDFGFLYDVEDRAPLGCYASNNFAARRAALARDPIPASPLRCNCYHHAQVALTQGTPFALVADAVVHHEVPSFFKERWRRGSDFVAETHVNAALPKARSSASLLLSAYRIYRENLRLDRQRLNCVPPALGFTSLDRLLAAIAFPAMRIVDLVAVVAALRREPQPRPEGGDGGVGTSRPGEAGASLAHEHPGS